jgi:hypothetical protein
MSRDRAQSPPKTSEIPLEGVEVGRAEESLTIPLLTRVPTAAPSDSLTEADPSRLVSGEKRGSRRSSMRARVRGAGADPTNQVPYTS